MLQCSLSGGVGLEQTGHTFGAFGPDSMGGAGGGLLLLLWACLSLQVFPQKSLPGCLERCLHSGHRWRGEILLVSSATKAPAAAAQDVPQYSWTRPLDSV